jgi:AcrR family transcriptional regulator
MAHIINSRSLSHASTTKKLHGNKKLSERRAVAHVSTSSRRRRAPRQQRAQGTVDAIVEAASRLLVESGYGSASTNLIAHRAGVSVGSLYQYFSSKEEVFREVVRRHREEVLPVIDAALDRMEESSEDIVEVTLELMRDMASVNARNPRLMAALDGELGWLEHDRDKNLDTSHRVERILRRRTALPPERIAVTAALMAMTVAPLSRWLVHGKRDTIDTEMFMQGVGRMLRGLLA